MLAERKLKLTLEILKDAEKRLDKWESCNIKPEVKQFNIFEGIISGYLNKGGRHEC